MMQRPRDALQQGRSEQPPIRQNRPNELRLDVIQAERLRREVQRGEPPASRPVFALEEQQERRKPAAAAPAEQARQAPERLSLLKTRSGIRQAWLLKEILAPPMALRRPQDGAANW